MRASSQRFASKRALLYPEGGSFKPLTYAEMADQVYSYARALDVLGLAKGDRLAIQAENSMEWALTDWAAQTLGVILVPIYPTLPADQAQYIVTDCGAKVVIAGDMEQQPKTGRMEGVRSVLLKGAGESIVELAEHAASPLTKEEWHARIEAVEPDDVATIIYTSGTTGNPKGAVLAHRAFVFLCNSVLKNLPINEQDTFLSFLPLSHVYERMAGHFLPISLGSTIGYAQSLRTLADDMQQVQPTVMLCVPRFLEALKDRIWTTAMKAPPLRRRLFLMAHAQGLKKAQGGFAPLYGLLDKLVGAKIRARTGGRLRFFVSGGAALPPHVSEFFQAFGVTILQGYGLTETAAATCVNHPDRNKPHTVGEPIEGMEVEIAPDGEILIRGPGRMVEYYNLPEETRAAIDEEGWFHTGDIGEFEGAHLKITDRKKDIIVLANGKNVAPQPIENKLKISPLIAEAVLFGDGNEFVYGLLVPNFEALREQVKAQGEAPKDDAELIKTDVAKKLVKEEVDRVNKTLADYEKVKRHVLLPKAFSIDEDELTPSMKVKRRVVREKYKALIADLER
jgi:long-chain acyl-CoA synthetase